MPGTSSPVTTVMAPSTPTTVGPTTTEPESSPPLFDFALDGTDGWYVQNDTVMGGVSSSSVESDGTDMIFSGNVSLDNNGGFASVRGPIFEPASDAAGNALSIDATGDGRTYLVQILTPTDAYVIRYVPTTGPSTLLFADFTTVSRFLDPVPAIAPLTAASLRQIAIYVLDKQVGEFMVRIRSISIVEA